MVVMNNPQGRAMMRSGHWLTYGLGTGSADLICCAFGRFVGLEVKTGDAELREEQKDWADSIRSAGGIAREVRSVGDALAAIEEARNETTYEEKQGRLC